MGRVSWVHTIEVSDSYAPRQGTSLHMRYEEEHFPEVVFQVNLVGKN